MVAQDALRACGLQVLYEEKKDPHPTKKTP